MSKANKGIFVVGALVAAIGLALYPVAVHPKLFPQKYQKMQKEYREGIIQDDIQPGGPLKTLVEKVNNISGYIEDIT